MDSVEFQALFSAPVRNGVYKAKEFQGHGVRLVKMNQLFSERRLRSQADGYDLIELSEKERQILLLKKSDLLFSRTSVVADGVGKCSIIAEVDEDLTWDSNIIRVRLDPELAYPLFYFYFFNSPHGRDVVKRLSSGAAVTTITGSGLAASCVPFPPLSLQRRIAGILSAYDELMENSQRRIKILEEMARSLYREWFVNFRFPGHEKLPRVASSLGDIPQGWEVKSIADVCQSVSYGYTASAAREEVGPKFLRITDIVPAVIDWAGVPYCEIPEAQAPKYWLKNGDIVVARTGATTGYAKRLNKLHPQTVFASYLVRARAKAGVSDRMLGILMESDEYKQFIKTNIGGAAQPQANAVVLTSMRLALPPSPLGKEFDRLVAPMIDETELRSVKMQNLRRTRDLLLPRLLSGQVNLAEN